MRGRDGKVRLSSSLHTKEREAVGGRAGSTGVRGTRGHVRSCQELSGAGLHRWNWVWDLLQTAVECHTCSCMALISTFSVRLEKS